MSSRASFRKVSLLTSCCWHWSNTVSMLSMYCGVHLDSSSRDFSYFSLACDGIAGGEREGEEEGRSGWLVEPVLDTVPKT